MRDELAKIFYDSGAIDIQKDNLNIELTKFLSSPVWVREISGYISRELDDYAIDCISATSDALPYATHCAANLDFPIQWVRSQNANSLPAEIKRTILLTSLTPPEEEIKTYMALIEASGLEVVGIYSILGLKLPTSPTRMLSLIALVELLEIYQKLYLIDEEIGQQLIASIG